MVLSLIPDSGKSGVGVGVDSDPRSPANRGWVPGPHPRSPANRGWGCADQSRNVYLVRLISTWYCIANGSCFPWHWTCLTRELAEDINSEERHSVRFLVNLGLGRVVYGLIVKCSAMSLFERS